MSEKPAFEIFEFFAIRENTIAHWFQASHKNIFNTPYPFLLLQ